MHSIKNVEPQPVTFFIYDRAGNTWHYKTIDALLDELERAFSRWSCQWGAHLVDTFGTSYWYDAEGRPQSSPIGTYAVRTNLGDIVPVAWLQALYRDRRLERRRSRHCRHQPEFRNGPWPSTRKRRGRYRGHRSVQTQNERTWYEADRQDVADAGWHADKVYRRRNIPNSYDDIARHKERGWKANRATQWRP